MVVVVAIHDWSVLRITLESGSMVRPDSIGERKPKAIGTFSE